MPRKVNLGITPVSVKDLAGKMPARLVVLGWTAAVVWLVLVAQTARVIGDVEQMGINAFIALSMVYITVVTVAAFGAGYFISWYRKRLNEKGVQKAIPVMKKYLRSQSVDLNDGAVGVLLRNGSVEFEDAYGDTFTLQLVVVGSDVNNSYKLVQHEGTPLSVRNDVHFLS